MDPEILEIYFCLYQIPNNYSIKSIINKLIYYQYSNSYFMLKKKIPKQNPRSLKFDALVRFPPGNSGTGFDTYRYIHNKIQP